MLIIDWSSDVCSAVLVDPSADVGRIRAHLEEVVRANKNWDGRVVGLQVTELYADQMELRALVSAADAGKAFDLRCDVREAMMAFITSEMPEAMVRRRGDLRISADRSQSANGGSAADRKSGVEGERVSVRVDLGGSGIMRTKKKKR